jgi:AAA+ superfamily predicted ATPase
MQTETLNNNKKRIIEDNKEYIESYFKVCELLAEKQLLLIRLKELYKDAHAVEKIQTHESRIEILNERIKSMDSSFWDAVRQSTDAGAEFVIEKLSQDNEISLYEKRIILFFLYLELCPKLSSCCEKSEIIEIFDFDNAIFNRLRNYKYFHKDAALLQKQFLTKIFVHEIGLIHLTLNCKLFNKIISLLNGEKDDVDISASSPSFDVNKDVGIVKEPEYKIEDVSLKDEIKDKVMFLLKASNDKTMEDLGISQKIKKGKGLAFLFYGPPGTGKSMLAEAIAAYLNKKILIVEFPKITSRWYGETDKQISNIFKTAKSNNLVICMDEADSLLYNRSYAVQEHDIRFVNVMLQEIERYEGEMILTSNMDTLLDPALERRVTLKVRFELPDKDLREKIWVSHIPDKVTISEDVNFAFLADQYELSGGYIKNAVFHALRRLANDNRSKLVMDDLVFGANLEKDGMFVKDNKQKIGFFANS